jgi:uncharacterized protein DUF4274
LVKIIGRKETDPSGDYEVILENVVEFILDQPQEFWLLYIFDMNWDVNDEIVEAIVSRKDTDLAIIAYLFWASGPSYYCKFPDAFQGSIVERILIHLRNGWYEKCEFWLPRSQLAGPATHFIHSALQDESTPFDVPLCLFGPFGGRKALIDFPLDVDSISLLESWFQDFTLDVTAAQSESYWDRYERLEILVILPQIKAGHAQDMSDVDMYDYCQSLYGTREQIQTARATPKGRRAVKVAVANQNRLQSPIGFINRLTTLEQSVLAVTLLGAWIWFIYWVIGYFR